jgi:ABC-2 type transport system ATP-binding protein
VADTPKWDVAISCRGLRRTFPGGVALDGLDLDVPRGTVLALLGPNGAGKTTTIRLLNGILAPHGGTATVLGLDPTVDGDELRARTGVLTENAGLDDRLTAHENLVATARMRGIRGPEAAARADELLELFGMRDHAHQRCQGFSTGQRRRVALARALLHDPEMLFLDEPTSGLDPTATADVLDLIEMLTSERGHTVVLCTHFLAEAGRLADQMAILHRGRLLTSGSPEALAAQLWPGLSVSLELDGPAGMELLGRLRGLDGVVGAESTDDGANVVVADRARIPAVVADLVSAGVAVYAATPRPKTLEDVYFAYQDTLGEDTAGLLEAMR